MNIPSSTAVAERGFSLWPTLIVSKKRDRLAERSTDALMRICHTDKDLNEDDLNSNKSPTKVQKLTIRNISLSPLVITS
jgi:hypothetical protein